MESERLASLQWFQQLAKVTEVIGQHEFVTTLVDALSCLAPIRAATVYLYPHEGLPTALFECDDEGPWLPEGNVKQYLTGFYLLDPFYGACVDNLASGCYHLADVAPDHFERSEYYVAFYQHAHIEDELNYILQVAPGLTLSLSLVSANKLSDAALRHFKIISPWVLSVLDRHWEGLGNDARGERFESPFARKVHAALKNFGCSLLSQRECEIAQCILRGHSTRSLAERLVISEDTVKTHRKHVYSKLDISSQSELFSLFIHSLAHAQGVLGKDPLETYLGMGARPIPALRQL
ncbi:LuxR family transcriptional regulator [Pseudomonas capeferrum]|uniref:helix-turn-helix transcriptional regulator n=1 Tax=Pseudomonas capeferrum TaxID=1495066 RepID=UPI0015E311BD|nr:helix-turn-helix transcriptional regulator [Pseudomonas capeferrum]MBA1200785.1 LuxR family transcriptional regulator [Pseudomonas capeferrum]